MVSPSPYDAIGHLKTEVTRARALETMLNQSYLWSYAYADNECIAELDNLIDSLIHSLKVANDLRLEARSQL